MLMHQTRPKRTLLWIEFLLIYVSLPLILWGSLEFTELNRAILYLVLLLATVLGLALLFRTDGFHFSSLWNFESLKGWSGKIIAFTVLVCMVLMIVVAIYAPERFFELPREKPFLLLMIWCFYPWVSVLGQEILFRPLFFLRYRRLFSSKTMALTINALIFSFAHIMFENSMVLVLTFAGGLVFGKIYQNTGSFPLVFILHWIAGGLVFTVGLGWFFYLGGDASIGIG